MTPEREVVARLLPGYEVGPELGRGATGLVFAGRHRHLGRDVAIKQLPRAFGADPELKARFAREARALATLDHPHVVPVYDYAEEGGSCVLVLERLTGGTLWARAASIDAPTACATVIAVCAGLDHAHRNGILHRDVKPDNILFAASGSPKVADFGIATLLHDPSRRLTRTGHVVGTPAYMAPEQAQGGPLSATTDVYATAVVAYELLAGRLPFRADDDPVAVLWRHVHEAPADLAVVAPDTPTEVAAAIHRALAKDPEYRTGSAEAFATELAAASTAAWGTDWLDATGVPVAVGPAVRHALSAHDRRPEPLRGNGPNAADLAELQSLTGFGEPAARLGRHRGTDAATLRAICLAGIVRWRERGEDLLASAELRAFCEHAVRAYEATYHELEGR